MNTNEKNGNMYKIIPKIGLDDVKFGMKRDDIENILGPPEEISSDDSIKNPFIIWHYWSKKLSFSFDSESDYRLTTIDIYNSDAKLFNLSIIGMKKEDVLSRLNLKGIEKPIITDESQDDFDWEMLDYEDMDINIWLEDGIVESVQWGVYVDENDQECWP